MTSRELIRWQSLHERRARSALASPLALALIGGALLAAWVATRGSAISASHAWLAAALVTSAVAFLRVPFLVYWRSDAAFLAQLPLDGRALADAALFRCARAAAATTVALAIGALPLGFDDTLLRHLAFAVALGAAAGAFLPALANLHRVVRRRGARVSPDRPAGAADHAPRRRARLRVDARARARDRRRAVAGRSRARPARAADPRRARRGLAGLARRRARARRRDDGEDPARRVRARPPAPRDPRDQAADRARVRGRARARRRRPALPQGRAPDAPPLPDGVRARRAGVRRADRRRPRAPRRRRAVRRDHRRRRRRVRGRARDAPRAPADRAAAPVGRPAARAGRDRARASRGSRPGSRSTRSCPPPPRSRCRSAKEASQRG